MTTRTSSKVTKTEAKQIIDDQVDQFSQLSNLVDNLVPDSSQLLPSKSEMRNCYERILSAFRQSVISICRLTSEDDAINFIEGVVSIYWQDRLPAHITNELHDSIADLISKNTTRLVGIFTQVPKARWYTAKKEIETYYVVSIKLISVSIDQLKEYKWKIIENWDDINYISTNNSYPTNYQYSYNIGPISNSSINGMVMGQHNSVVSSLNAAGQPGLAQAVRALTVALLDSTNLPDQQKQGRVKFLTQIGQEVLQGVKSNAIIGG